MAKHSLSYTGSSSQYSVLGTPPNTILTINPGSGAVGPWTYNVWVKSTQTTTAGLIGRLYFGALVGRAMMWGNDSANHQLNGLFQDDSGSYNDGQTPSSPAWNDGSWHMVTMVFQGNNANGVGLYVDGSLVGSFTSSSGGTLSNDNSKGFLFGAADNAGTPGGTGTTGFLTGKLAQPSVWESILTGANITSLFNGTDPATIGSPVGLWYLTEGTGTTAADSGSGNNTMTNITGATGPAWDTDIPSQIASSASPIVPPILPEPRPIARTVVVPQPIPNLLTTLYYVAPTMPFVPPVFPEPRPIPRVEVSWIPPNTVVYTVVPPFIAYVDHTAGSDSNPGTITQPWQTIGKVNSSQPLLGVRFQGGQTHPGNLVWTSAGTQAARVSIQSYGSGQATLSSTSGKTVLLHGAQYVDVENLTITSAVTSIGSFAPGGATGYDYTTTDSCITIYDDRTSGSKLNSITVQNCTLTQGVIGVAVLTPNYGQAVVGFDGVAIVNCTISDQVIWGFFSCGGNGQSAGWSQQKVNIPNVNTTFQGILLRGCSITGITGTGLAGEAIHLANTTGYVIERCLIDNISYADTTGNSLSWSSASIEIDISTQGLIQWNEVRRNATTISQDGTAIDCDIGCTNTIVQFNRTYKNAGAGFSCFSDATNVFRFNESYLDCQTNGLGAFFAATGTGLTAYHNTIYMNSSCSSLAAVFEIDSGITANITNNIISVDSGRKIVKGGGTYTFAGNVYWWAGGTQSFDGTITTLSAWRTSGQETVNGVIYGVVADPLLSNPTNAGTFLPSAQVNTCTFFDLQGGSPAIGEGVPPEVLGLNFGSVDFHGYPYRTGLAVDAGACAYNASSLVPGFGATGQPVGQACQ